MRQCFGQSERTDHRRADADQCQDDEDPAPVEGDEEGATDAGRQDRRNAEHEHQPAHHNGNGVTAVEVADDRHGDHCRGRRAHALENPQDAEDSDARCEDRQQRSQDMDADSGKQRLFAAESVRERPDQQLSECEADESSGDGQLNR